MRYSSRDVAQCGLHIINVEIKPAASVIVLPDFILGCIGTPYNKGKFNRLLCQSRAEGWKGFLTPAKPLRTLPATKDCGPESGSLCIVPMIILFPASCMAWGAWSFYLSINIITATLKGVYQCTAPVCVWGTTMAGGCQTDFFPP